VKHHALPLFLTCVSALSIIVAIGIAVMPGSIDEPSTSKHGSRNVLPLIQSRLALFLIMGALFLVYVGTENGFGGWVASYAKSLGNLTPAMSLMTPSFFYTALMLGRWLAPLLLRSVDEVQLARAGLLIACVGTTGLLFSHGLSGVMVSACAAGLGLSCVYPITISLLSLEYGSASSLIGSFMFVLSNIGGGLFPWIVGVSANRFGTLKAGLFVPLLGCVVMYALYQRKWSHVPIEPPA
jgi:fucose permease